MSEFTDIMAFLTEADSLEDLRGQFVQSLPATAVPFADWPFDTLETDAGMAAYWSKLPKPQWVVFGAGDPDEPYAYPDLTKLAKIGPVYHLTAEEDFASWSLNLHCGGQTWSYSFLVDGIGYREATIDIPEWHETGTQEALSKMAACLNVPQKSLEETFIPDAGESYSALVGAYWEQMMDLSSSAYEIQPGQVEFGFADW